MIIGNDLDSLLSACLLKSHFGWDITGIYDYHSLWFDGNLTTETFLQNLKASQYIAVDLDIYRNYLPSIGHHILALHPNDLLPQHQTTLNPNFLNGVTNENFKQKYPLGTVHFLMWLLEEYPVMTRRGELLLWLADSSFINAQSHRFKENVRDWLKNIMPNQLFLAGFEQVDSVKFEQEILERVFPLLVQTGLAKGKGQVQSKYLKLEGFQCQWDNPNNSRDQILSAFALIEKETGWQSPNLPGKFNVISGKRFSTLIREPQLSAPGFLRKFLAERKVFSYVFVLRNKINYTTGIDY